MTTAITMTEKTADTITPTKEKTTLGGAPARHIDRDYVKARERLRAVLSLLSALVDEHDADEDRHYGHVGDLNHYAEVLEGTLCLGETVE